MLTPVCISDAVENPDVTGPIKAIGAMKHPDSNTPSVVNASSLLNIDSPLFNYSIIFLFLKKEDLLQSIVVKLFF